jgi:hypothetical protein
MEMYFDEDDTEFVGMLVADQLLSIYRDVPRYRCRESPSRERSLCGEMVLSSQLLGLAS